MATTPNLSEQDFAISSSLLIVNEFVLHKRENTSDPCLPSPNLAVEIVYTYNE